MDEEAAARVEARTLRDAGDARDRVLATLFDAHRRRLLRMIHLRMDPRLKARVGASDVLQEAYLEVAARVAEYVQDPRLPFFLWLRILTAQRLIRLQRRHLGAQKRDVRQEIRMDRGVDRGAMPAATSVALADGLAAAQTTPTQAVQRDELRTRVLAAIEALPEADREILALRNFEELTNAEAATELGITEAAASKRYQRALAKLQSTLDPE